MKPTSFFLFGAFILATGMVLTACDNSGTQTVCGDGKAAGTESCDGNDLRNQTCQTLGYYGEQLACSASCGWDLSSCEITGQCGDGVIQQPAEQCDGLELNGATCASMGLGAGTLTCNAQCRFDTSGCEIQPVCGDGVRQGAEECENTNMGNASCESLGFTGGTLTCTPTCMYDISNCIATPQCQDGVATGNEECDRFDFRGQSCEQLGYYGGQLECTTDCRLNRTHCETAGRCGDGIIQTQ